MDLSYGEEQERFREEVREFLKGWPFVGEEASVAHALDEHLPDAERQATLAKAHITDRALSVARDAVELHGGLGFTWACDVQIWFKRAMFDRGLLNAREVLGFPIAHIQSYGLIRRAILVQPPIPIQTAPPRASTGERWAQAK